MLSKVLQTRDVSTFLELQFVSAGSSRGLDILGYCTECPTSTGVLYTLLHVVEMLSNGLCPTSTGVHYTILQQTTSRNSCRNSSRGVVIISPNQISIRHVCRCQDALVAWLLLTRIVQGPNYQVHGCIQYSDVPGCVETCR